MCLCSWDLKKKKVKEDWIVCYLVALKAKCHLEEDCMLFSCIECQVSLGRGLYAIYVDSVALMKAKSHLRRGLYAMCVELLDALKAKSRLLYNCLA